MSAQFKPGDRVTVHLASQHAGMREPGTVKRCYNVSRPFAHIDLDNGQEWFAQYCDLRRLAEVQS